MLFFSSKKSEVDFPIGEYLATDMHSHLLPGVDDGAPNVEASLKLIKGLTDIGFKKVITSPHIMLDIHKNNRETLAKAYQTLEEELNNRTDLATLDYAAEYLMDENYERLLKNKDLLLVSKNYVLVETPILNRLLNLETIIFNTLASGYTPIIAHPERYVYLFGKNDDYEELKEKGCLLQINALSLTGYYGKPEKMAAEWLLENKLVDFIGTDMHHERHLARLTHYKISKKSKEFLEQTTLMNSEL